MDFVMIARDPESSVSEACRQFCISRKTGYRWLNRYETGGPAGLTDRSRQPDSNPLRVSGDVVLELIGCAGNISTEDRRSCALPCCDTDSNPRRFRAWLPSAVFSGAPVRHKPKGAASHLSTRRPAG
jgi:transposase-like protein